MAIAQHACADSMDIHASLMVAWVVIVPMEQNNYADTHASQMIRQASVVVATDARMMASVDIHASLMDAHLA